MNRNGKVIERLLLSALILSISFMITGQAVAGDAVIPALVSAEAGSSSWMTVVGPFDGDDNANSYTIFEYSYSEDGPWTMVCGNGVPGESGWRVCTAGNLAPDADYFVRVTFVDPDGVIGPNPQIIGPVRTNAISNAPVLVGPAVVSVEETYIFVSVPVGDDYNMNSLLYSVEVSTTNAGPWEVKCGPYSTFNPKICRIHSLIQDTDYWVRLTVTDPDGVYGASQQVIGPITYTGLTNLALNQGITADSGWGCCANPYELINGRIQNPYSSYGFAWTGGTSRHAGGFPGYKQATIDLGSIQEVNRVDIWLHNPTSYPTDWQILVSDDGITFNEVFATTEPRCRTETLKLYTGWWIPSCSHSASFSSVEARYVRYIFDDSTLFDGMHGMAVEIEVFSALITDEDGDGIPNNQDNCQFVANADQKDVDGDGYGDLCDDDSDGDGVLNATDNCPLDNATGRDANGDGCIDNIADLPAVIEELQLQRGIENSMVSIANNAAKSLEKGKKGAATNQINAFINSVKAQKGKKLTESEADTLINFAQNVIDGQGP